MPRNLDLPLIGVVAAALVVALVVALVSTPVVKNLAIRVKAVDVPKDDRRMHDHPIPRMGGLAIFLGFLLSVLLFMELTAQMRGMLLGAVIIVVLGIFDDIYSLPAMFKFVVQIVAALVAVLSGNVIEALSNPNVFSSDLYWELGWLSIPVTVIWIVAITNAVNLIDGLDGLACGVSTISSMTLLVIALVVSDGRVAILMAALAGGCLGFLPYNMNPAKIFMGDTGSTFLGLSWRWCPSRACSSSTPSSPSRCPSSCWACPSLTPALPLSAASPTGRAPCTPTAAMCTTGSSTWASTRSRRWRCSI